MAACLASRTKVKVKVSITVATQTDEWRIEKIYATSYGEKFHFDDVCYGLRQRTTPVKCLKPCKICASSGFSSMS